MARKLRLRIIFSDKSSLNALFKAFDDYNDDDDDDDDYTRKM